VGVSVGSDVGVSVGRAVGASVNGAPLEAETLVISLNPAEFKFISPSLLKLSTIVCNLRRTASLNNLLPLAHARHCPETV
jgi:hypothetical protein